VSRIDELAEKYGKHVQTPWPKTIAGAQRVIMVVYDKEQERVLRAKKDMFEMATMSAGKSWKELDLTTAFSAWLAEDEDREAYFESPEYLRLRLDAEFASYVAAQLRNSLSELDDEDSTVLAVLGLGSLFGFASVSNVLKLIEADIRGRLLLFFPGHVEGSNLRLLDARDGWNYLVTVISLHGEGAWV